MIDFAYEAFHSGRKLRSIRVERQSTDKWEIELKKIIVASPIISERAGPAWLIV